MPTLASCAAARDAWVTEESGVGLLGREVRDKHQASEGEHVGRIHGSTFCGLESGAGSRIDREGSKSV